MAIKCCNTDNNPNLSFEYQPSIEITIPKHHLYIRLVSELNRGMPLLIKVGLGEGQGILGFLLTNGLRSGQGQKMKQQNEEIQSI